MNDLHIIKYYTKDGYYIINLHRLTTYHKIIQLTNSRKDSTAINYIDKLIKDAYAEDKIGRKSNLFKMFQYEIFYKYTNNDGCVSRNAMFEKHSL